MMKKQKGITEKERLFLKSQLQQRMKIRREKENQRRKEYYK